METRKGYRLLWEIAKPLHGAQAKTLVAMTRGLVECGKMRSFDIGQGLASSFGILFKSGLQRFYRFVHYPRFDDLAVCSELAHQLLRAGGKRPLVAVDWTEWHCDLRVLAATACVGWRAVPIYAQAFGKQDMPRSQNTRENTFLGILSKLSPFTQAAVFIFDRGFRRVSFIRELQWLHRRFIVRMAAGVTVSSQIFQGLLSEYPLQPGQAVDLGLCRLRRDQPVKTRIVGMWAKGQAEPWWLATDLNEPLGQIAESYDRRMSIEEQFRDGKGCRYGVKLKWMKFKKSEHLNRLYLLLALALVIWTAAGVLACQHDATLRLHSKSKGPRRSLVAVGIQAKHLARKALGMSWSKLLKLWPPPEIRRFAWE